ncbi:5'-deoxynucleotidase [Clostridium thermosuccinogenes]|uniref:5'-deoxynucleotidase n=1 Tax=Clostridium thermosuccinogenes TaxID=84032 RepID=A0A2K2FN33_9CLOT|nr:5'-deoxynucleotidase [Pseudoclostridium thermosuccinogenes]AUS97890.1 5'-deoxynucleotidase [Pseudoclostridium thermosuccinogenes]PNU00187.1 5'-deoxynucleotidase [Pseudoclostridium thermosuccinogenes]PNU01511.1 5'-deoxynucleotidase [Pseudoclostridium thermosuccinogenes]
MAKSGFHFFAFLSRMKYITRWGLMKNTQPENIQEHSLQVAMIAHGLALIRNKFYGGNINADRVAVLGLFHDCNEIITGDMPTPIKYYNPQISRAYKDVEETSKRKILSMLPKELQSDYTEILFHEDIDPESWKIVKAADKISAYIKCLEEVKAGNMEFKKASESIYDAISQIDMPEVAYFMKNFIPSFSLTLDELD